MSIVTINGQLYKLDLIPLDPIFDPLDKVSRHGEEEFDTITYVSSDRYYINFTDDYILFEDQDKYSMVGKTVLA